MPCFMCLCWAAFRPFVLISIPFLFKTGMLKLASDTLFIHPLPTHLAKRAASSEVKTPHLIYKRSLPVEFDPHDMRKGITLYGIY